MKRTAMTMTGAVFLAALLQACGDGGEPSQQGATSGTMPETQDAVAPEAAPAMDSIGAVVQTPLGAVRGERTEDGTVGASAWIYRGVPYAEPPVDELRWRAPQPVQPWEGELDATGWPNRCPQGSSSMGAANPISEDCLYLNIVTNAESAGEELPVMVFFHGGGLTTGTGNSPTYTHPTLPSKDVVLITVNSRLGPIGYLAHPALSAEDENGVSGNYGTLDLMASLRWVRDNIAAFGGDPDNVTIFGESGGGTKAISQMAAPMAEGLFHRAIVQSGSALVSEERVTMLDEAEATGERLVAELGLDGSGDVLAAMRATPWEDIIEAGSSEHVGFRANVVVDGHIIPDTVHNLFRNGEQADVPLIVGANAGESSLQGSVPLMADLHSASADSDTFVYAFTQVPRTWRDEPCVAFHGLELPYVFGSVPIGIDSPTMLFLSGGGGCESNSPEVDEVDMRVADQASTLWAEFARTGNPSVEGLIEWPAYTGENDVYLDIGDPLEVKEGVESSYTPPPSD